MTSRDNWVCITCRVARRAPRRYPPPCLKCGGEMRYANHVPPKSDDKAWRAMATPPKKPKGTVRQARLHRRFGWDFEKYYS